MKITNRLFLMSISILFFSSHAFDKRPTNQGNQFLNKLSRVSSTICNACTKHKCIIGLGAAGALTCVLFRKPIIHRLTCIASSVKDFFNKQKPNTGDLPSNQTSCSGRWVPLTRADLPPVNDDTMLKMIEKTMAILPNKTDYIQAQVIPSNSQILVVGDIHSEVDVLIRNINSMRDEGFFMHDNPWQLKGNNRLIFTGDLEDRGQTGLEVWQIAMLLLQHNPKNVFIIRGNHEDTEIATNYGFFNTEISSNKFKQPAAIIEQFSKLFDRLPFAVFLGIKPSNQQQTKFGMFCHGGIESRPLFEIGKVLSDAQANPGNIQDARLESKAVDNYEPHRNGFNWGDFSNNNFGSLGYGNTGARGVKNVSQYNRLGFANFIANLLNPRYVVDFVARGHQHNPHAITKLNKIGATPEWKPVTKRSLQVKPGSIFTFMSLSGLFGHQVQQQHAHVGSEGFGVFCMDPKGSWQLIPHLYPRQ